MCARSKTSPSDFESGTLSSAFAGGLESGLRSAAALPNQPRMTRSVLFESAMEVPFRRAGNDYTISLAWSKYALYTNINVLGGRAFAGAAEDASPGLFWHSPLGGHFDDRVALGIERFGGHRIAVSGMPCPTSRVERAARG